MKESRSGTPLLEVRGLEKRFEPDSGWVETLRFRKGRIASERRAVHAVNDVSLDVTRGEALCIVGESGCGKSTAARRVASRRRPSCSAPGGDPL